MTSTTKPPELAPVQVSSQPAPRPMRASRMEPEYWIPRDTTSLVDVGCNAGALLEDCRHWFPNVKLAGVDINADAIQIAKRKLPDAEIQQAFGFELPFADNRFDCATCIEVIEHVPQEYRAQLVAEIRRVLRPGGRMILRCPHDGIFSCLDAQNFRFRWPRLYQRLVGEGSRDVHYREVKEELVWHHHFRREELLEIAGPGWKLEECHFGGLLLFPISDVLRWPFYRKNRGDHWMVRALEKMATWELAYSFGRSSYGILIVMTKV